MAVADPKQPGPVTRAPLTPRAPETVGARIRRARRRSLWAHKSGVIGALLIVGFGLMALIGPLLVPYDPIQQDLSQALRSPSPARWIGTDELGRDVLSRLVGGARHSLVIAFSSATGGLVIGTILGMSSGYWGGVVEALAMRATDVLLALPGMLLAMTVIAIVGTDLQGIVLAVGVYSIPGFSRMAHSSTLVVRTREFVEAARCIGATDARILWQHVLPNIFAPLLILWSLRLGTVVLTVSSLSFLGLGVQPPLPEWGAMLNSGRSYLRTSPHMVVGPGLAIFLLVLAFNLVGDVLRDLLDPRAHTLGADA